MLKTTTLRNVGELTANEFGLTAREHTRLLEAQTNRETVTVDCEACEGYYDITLSDGTEYVAISTYHLVGF